MNDYEAIIGLEIHVELSTKSKMFCSCSADYFGKDPNTHTCPICLGLPGALPKPNKKGIEYAQKFAAALGCQLQLSSKFDRKNYFYPDLAKGFQISQYDLPFSQKGQITITLDGRTKRIAIARAHLEEDTGKLSHTKIDGRNVTLIDFNRSGVPLLEIVSDPEISSAAEAKTYAQKLQQIARYLNVSDADMEKGSMRIEPNVSLRKVGEKSLPKYKVELKNINSFRFAEKAIEYEISRQTEQLESDQTPQQETRGWNETQNKTVSQRSKEEAQDYRYFPEPDLPPFTFTQDYFIELKRKTPELPDQKLARFTSQYQLSKYDAGILTRDRIISEYFEEAVKVGRKHQVDAKTIANVIINKKPDIAKVLPAQLILDLVKAKEGSTISRPQLEKTVGQVLKTNSKAVDDYKKGKANAIMFLTGQVVKLASGKADPKQVMILLKEKLNG